MFSAETLYWCQKPVLRLFHPQGAQCILYLGASGAITSATLVTNYKSVEVIWGPKNEQEWIQLGTQMYTGSFLFPFPNRIKDGLYTHEGETFQLPINEPDKNNALHGLVAFETFECVALHTSENAASCTLQYQMPPTSHYPFSACIQISYTLYMDRIVVETIVQSSQQHPVVPYGIGFHPYFTLPGSPYEWKLQLPSTTALQTDALAIPTGAFKKDTRFQKLTSLYNTQLDTCYKLKEENTINEVRLLSQMMVLSLKLKNFDYLQLYTPAGYNCIAIEPMTCAANAFNNKNLGLKYLRPNEQHHYHWEVGLKSI